MKDACPDRPFVIILRSLKLFRVHLTDLSSLWETREKFNLVLSTCRKIHFGKNPAQEKVLCKVWTHIQLIEIADQRSYDFYVVLTMRLKSSSGHQLLQAYYGAYYFWALL